MDSREELAQLIDNLDDNLVDIIAHIAMRAANVSHERWTGKLSFDLNVNQGTFGDTHINQGEVIRAKKSRRVRSRL